MEICTSHFKEDLRWLEKSPWPVSIVHHEGGDPVDCAYTIPNIGFEATSYLKYIIERYDTLPDHVAFIHGHEEAWHQQGDRSLFDMIRTANIQKYDFVPINNAWRCVNSELQMKAEIEFVEHFNLPSVPVDFITCCGGQFIVSKRAILKNPKSVYEYLYNIAGDKTSAIYFELQWHSIFRCGDSIIPRYDYFDPPLKEILYHNSCNIRVYLNEFTPCFIGKNPYPGMIHVETQEEYDYYSIRGASFFVHYEDIEVNFILDTNKLFFLHDVVILFKTMKKYDDIANSLKH
jgi:hypothetical protein